MDQYFVIFKPMNMLSQFSKEAGSDKMTLADLGTFPKDVYPVGRLDSDSEGLLILTNDKTLNNKLLDPSNGHDRTYLVQVEGNISREALEELKSGVTIRINKKDHRTRTAKAVQVKSPDWLPERNPPVRYRAEIPTSWIELTISEGKNRQVRRMTAAVGYPTLRLVRKSIERLDVRSVLPQTLMEIEQQELMDRLFN
ncbi:MAG: 23S rRNA pseudouridine2457 synthase [Parvicellaceae bacterium]|jgi:23S rRNA pseudouridine2457 synthase